MDPITFEQGAGGLVRAVIATEAAEAHVYLHGGHLTHWQPRGQAPVLFLSARSAFSPERAIRGGVPVIFPWFGPRAGDAAAPMHGFARVSPWHVESGDRLPGGRVALTLRLDTGDATRALWPHAFTLRLRVTVGESLDLGLEIVNASPEAWTFEAALHTYLAVGDVRAVSIGGLEGATYIDKTDALTRKRAGGEPLRLTTETDRVFVGTRATCTIDDPVLGRRLAVDKRGSATTVVWNPWADKARTIADLSADDWQRMLCVETANAADDAVRLAPGARHEMGCRLSVK